MFKNKVHNFKILNKKLPLINLLFLIAVTYLGFIVNYWYFLFYILVVLCSITIKPNKHQVLFCLGLLIVYLPIVILIPWFTSFRYLSDLLQSNFIRFKIFHFLESHYKKEVSDFIKLILFGIKSNSTYYFFKQVTDLGIIWLLSVGGFHINFLSRIIKIIFRKKQKVGWIINIIIISFISYLLRFNYSSTRILLLLLFLPLFNKTDLNRFNKAGFVGLIICLLNPACLKSIGFLLGFLCVVASGLIAELKFNNKIVAGLLSSSFCFLITIPFVTFISKKASLFTFINSFLFSYLFGFQFLYFLIFSWMPFMQVVHIGLITANYAIIGNVSYFNIFIYFNEWKPYIVFVYYLIIYIIKKTVYLIVKNNKI